MKRSAASCSRIAADAQRVGAARRVVLVQPRQRGGERDVAAVAEDDDRLGDRARLRRQPREPDLHGARDALGRQRAHARGLLGGGRDRLGGQRPGQLAEQERVAAADLVAGRGERGVRRALQLGGQQRARPVRAQRARLQPRRGAVGGDPRQRALGAGLVRAAGDREQDRQLLQPRDQEPQEVQRRRVGPVRVVDAEQQRRAARPARRSASRARAGPRTRRPRARPRARARRARAPSPRARRRARTAGARARTGSRAPARWRAPTGRASRRRGPRRARPAAAASCPAPPAPRRRRAVPRRRTPPAPAPPAPPARAPARAARSRPPPRHSRPEPGMFPRAATSRRSPRWSDRPPSRPCCRRGSAR